MKTQCNAVNLSFTERVQETKKAKDKLEQHLDKVDFLIVWLTSFPLVPTFLHESCII